MEHHILINLFESVIYPDYTIVHSQAVCSPDQESDIL